MPLLHSWRATELIYNDLVAHWGKPHYIWTDDMLQEGFGLSSLPILHGQGAVHDVISFKAWFQMRFVPKQAVQCEPSM